MGMISDSLRNVVTGLGVAGATKRSTTGYSGFRQLDRQEIDAAYRSSWMARALVDMPVDDALDPGVIWQAEDDQIAALEAEDRRLGFGRKRAEAVRMARKTGGAALMIDDQGDTTTSFDPNTIRAGSIRSFIVLSKSELSFTEYDRDILSPGYGYPLFWSVSSGSSILTVDPSRLVFFEGDRILQSGGLGAKDVFGDSVLQSRIQSIKDAEASVGYIVELMSEASVDIISIDGLKNIIAGSPKGQQTIMERLSLFRQSKSTTRTGILDKEEAYSRHAVQFGALPQLLREIYQIASGATGIPATRLLGRAPAGMNSTGDGDERVYFDRLDALRNDVKERTASFDTALIRSALGDRPEGLDYSWPALRQVSDKEKAENVERYAKTFETLARTGLFSPEELRATAAATMIQAELLPGLEMAMLETDDQFDLGGDDE